MHQHRYWRAAWRHGIVQGADDAFACRMCLWLLRPAAAPKSSRS